MGMHDLTGFLRLDERILAGDPAKTRLVLPGNLSGLSRGKQSPQRSKGIRVIAEIGARKRRCGCGRGAVRRRRGSRDGGRGRLIPVAHIATGIRPQ